MVGQRACAGTAVDRPYVMRLFGPFTNWEKYSRKRNCYCFRWGMRQNPYRGRLPKGYCGTCSVCGKFGHSRHYPGSVPCTGGWCDEHYEEERLKAIKQFREGRQDA